MKLDKSGLNNLWDILIWLWCVMADQVNYPYDPEYETEDALWPEWDWAMTNARHCDHRAPWNRQHHKWFEE